MLLAPPVSEQMISSDSTTPERRYIVQRWNADRGLLRWSSLAAAILNPAGCATDFAIAGWGTTSFVLLGLRFAAGAAAAVLYWASRSEQPPADPERLERQCIMSFALTVISGVLGPTLLRPTTVAAQGGPLLAIILLYSLCIPVWRRGKMFVFLLASILYLLVGLYARSRMGYGGKHELITISIFLTAASVLGPSTLARFERMQREIFDTRGDLDATIAHLRVESAERARQAERLEVAHREASIANEAKSYFLASVSHDLRTPIAGILSTAELLAETKMNDDQQKLLEVLSNSGRLLLAVVNDILDLSKLEAGKLTIEQVSSDVSQIANTVVSLLVPQANAKGIDLHLHVSSEITQSIVTDPIRLQQILFNLVGNAVKFTSAGKVDVRLFLDTAPGKTKTLRIEVSDTGIGMKPETLERLFQPFMQAEAATTRRFGGTGLGLAISKRLVELLGGSISVESHLGQGSVFRVELPAVFAASVVKADVKAESFVRKLRVLVAEDNDINAMIATRVLRALGHDCERVADGRAAVDAAQNGAFDLILMDMQMPVMDGPEAVQEIRQFDSPVAKVPIIALTADAIEAHRPRYFSAGVDGILTKPYTRVELSNALEKVLRERHA